ncbi:hypothetical protein [Paraburkholderia tropica]|uniref:hypothetical protein n=1 Tax=Paraburkholderia tropica TaxID=92647 RepID=UPI002AB6138E|nr:hypothetical protein [Paraburkholderia tropica]
MKRRIPNQNSSLLAHAVIGGVGLGAPPVEEAPSGMATLVLYVPLETVLGKSPPDIQDDLGLPWHLVGGDPVWFDELDQGAGI